MARGARSRPPRVRAVAVCSGLALVLGAVACRRGPPPEVLFREAEALRQRYEEKASREAIAKYRLAQSGWTRQGDRRSAARAAHGMGATQGQLGALDESLRTYRSALELARGSGDARLEIEVRSDAGLAQVLVAESDQAFAAAREQCQGALDMARGSGDAAAESVALGCLGEVAYYRQHPAEALGLYQAAERVSAAIGDRAGQAQALLYQGYVHSDSSRFEEARACYERAQSAWSALGDQRKLAIARVAVARLHVRLGHYQQGLDEFRSALDRLRPMGDALWVGSSLTGIARVYLDLGETRLALRYWEEALRSFEAVGLRSVVVDVLVSLGESCLASGDDTRAFEAFTRALVLADELRIERWRAVALRFVGAVYLRRRQPDEARRYLESALAMAPSVADQRLEAQTRTDLAEVGLLVGDPRGAGRYFEEALGLSRATGDRVSEARGLFGLARTSAGRGDLDAARRHVRRALAVAESLRTATESRELRASYLASVYRYYELETDVLMRLHRVRPGAGLAAAAFHANERARARSLLDRLTEAGVDLRSGVDPALLERERALRGAFEDWARRAGVGARASRTDGAFVGEYAELEERHAQLQAEIRRRSPRYAALVQPQPLSLAQVQKEVLDAHTLLLEYALGEERSYLWVVSAKGVETHVLAPRSRIEAAAARVYERLTARLRPADSPTETQRLVAEADAQYWKDAAELGDLLLGPLARRLAGRRLLVVADGALQYVPFAALPAPGAAAPAAPLAAGHEVVSLPSASVLGVLRNQTRGRPVPSAAVAVFADPVYEHDDPRLAAPPSPDPGRREFPRLAATRREATAIVSAAEPGGVLRATGFQASRATATSPDLARYRIVHFAAHGVYDDERPDRSGIVLSMFDERGRAQDGFLRLHDIYGLDLPAELVVLSACDTALGRPVRGEGLVGMVRGFLHAGAKRVVASLWRVDDEATGELMHAFYRGMLEEGRTPADALRQAQIGLWRSRRWHAPFYWASFVLQGEPR